MPIQMDIIAVILHFFPEVDILPSYEKETGLHLFQVILEAPKPTFSITMPAGFLMSEIHVREGKAVVFQMLIHEEVFKGIYMPKAEPVMRVISNRQPQFFG